MLLYFDGEKRKKKRERKKSRKDVKRKEDFLLVEFVFVRTASAGNGSHCTSGEGVKQPSTTTNAVTCLGQRAARWRHRTRTLSVAAHPHTYTHTRNPTQVIVVARVRLQSLQLHQSSCDRTHHPSTARPPAIRFLEEVRREESKDSSNYTFYVRPGSDGYRQRTFFIDFFFF